MPQIPFQIRTVGIPESVGGFQTVQANPSLFAQEGAAIAQGGAALAKTANEAILIDQRIKRAEQVAQLSSARTSLDTDLDTFRAGLEGNANPDSYQEIIDNTYNSLKTKYQTQYTDPDVWKALEPFFENKFNESKLKIKTQERKLRIDNAMGSLLNDNDEDVKRLAYAQSPDDQDIIKNRIDLRLANAVNLGIMHDKDRVKLLLDINNKTDKYRVESMINANPEIAYKYLNDVQYYPSLKPEERAQFIKAAESAAWVKYGRLEKQEKELQEDTTLKIYNMIDGAAAGKIDPKAVMAEIDRGMQRDPVSGIRAISPTRGRALVKELERELKGEGTEKNPALYSDLKSKNSDVLEGKLEYLSQKSAITSAWQDGKITAAEAKSLADDLENQRRAFAKLNTREDKELMKLTIASANKNVDALFPVTKSKGDKLLNASLKSAILTGSKNYADAEKFSTWVNDLVTTYAKTESEKSWVSKTKIAEAINKTMAPPAASPTPTAQPQTSPVPQGWKATGEFYQGKPVYTDQNGKRKVWQ